MSTVLPSEIKKGTVVVLDGAPQLVEETHLTGTAQTKHKLHVRLRHLITNKVVDRTFSDSERLPVAEIEHRRVQFSYSQGSNFTFLDAATFDELVLEATQIGDRKWFLQENEEYPSRFLNGKLLDIVLPPNVTLKIVETAPPVRGGSDATWKPAKLETGLDIMVPLFIANGESVRVDTQTRKYLGRDVKEK